MLIEQFQNLTLTFSLRLSASDPQFADPLLPHLAHCAGPSGRPSVELSNLLIIFLARLGRMQGVMGRVPCCWHGLYCGGKRRKFCLFLSYLPQGPSCPAMALASRRCWRLRGGDDCLVELVQHFCHHKKQGIVVKNAAPTIFLW